MLISCTFCKSKYLLNSADLRPKGRTVQCANCGNQWYQEVDLIENDKNQEQLNSVLSAGNTQNEKENLEFSTPNLPSTYVKEQKVSVLNSILVVLFVFFLISVFWIMQNFENNSFVLFKFYIDEFTFNLKLIFNDIAKIIHQIIN